MASAETPYRVISNTHLVKGEDLNHHHTLYGGRCVEWCVHMAYITAQSCFEQPRSIVFMSIRSLSMRAPARLGDIVELVGKVDYVGESTIGIRVDGRKFQPEKDPRPVVTGTFLFCTVDERGQAIPHGLPAVVNCSNGTKNRWVAAEQDYLSVMT